VQTNIVPAVKGTDQKPFRKLSVKARRGHHGQPAVKKAKLEHAREVSTLPPSRARGQGVQHAKKTSPGHHTGQLKHQVKTHKPAKPPHVKKTPPPPPPNNGKGKGPTGEHGAQGNGHDKNQ
jgi:hypothetical protein